jgi:hypothetical protein
MKIALAGTIGLAGQDIRKDVSQDAGPQVHRHPGAKRPAETRIATPAIEAADVGLRISWDDFGFLSRLSSRRSST